MPVMTPPPLLPPREHGQPVAGEGLTPGRSDGGGEEAALLWLPGRPSPSWSIWVLLCGGLTKEGRAHRGIYSVHRDRGLRFEWDCEGPSLRCLPGLCLHLGERNWAAACWTGC